MLTDCARGRTWVLKVSCSVILVRNVDRLHMRVLAPDLGFIGGWLDYKHKYLLYM